MTLRDKKTCEPDRLHILKPFDQTLVKDEVTNRFQDSLNCFHDLMKNSSLKKVSVIILLNKMDLFTDKIQHLQFKDYVWLHSLRLLTEGPNSAKNIIAYCQSEYSSLNDNPSGL
jgi:G-protein alpha subunit